VLSLKLFNPILSYAPIAGSKLSESIEKACKFLSLTCKVLRTSHPSRQHNFISVQRYRSIYLLRFCSSPLVTLTGSPTSFWFLSMYLNLNLTRQ